MIAIEERDGRIVLSVLGEFTLDDCREFEDYLIERELFDGRHDLIFDLTQMVGMTIDAAIEEFKFTKFHGGEFRRVAVVTDSQWLAWAAWLERLLVGAELRVFSSLEEAEAWLGEDTSPCSTN
ncbi:MAG: STAS/SEC14 domain-containing protein [Rhodocyclaceae bacterium]|nr:STAS/SEC14 domain-containing protein [Rhodocyclaceae bacterium]